MTLCGLAEDASVVALGAQPQPLLIDPTTGTARCAGFWPRVAGWHLLRSGKAQVPLYVRAPRELPGAVALQDRDATQRLMLRPPNRTISVATAPGTRWPWFLAWLVVSAALWWLERTRIGHRFTS